MAGPGVFHVEFGINETKLTKSLEQRKYKEAEKIINECVNQTFLDEGCYQRTPLYITLCGFDQEEDNVAPRNLYVADQLVQYGANVNLRIPSTYFGSEYMGPGHSPLELIVNFYNFVTLHESHILNPDGEKTEWNPYYHLVIGLDNLIVMTYDALVEQLEHLIFSMLARGGETGIRDEFRMTLLHRTVALSREISLVRVLTEAGADLNAVDCRGNTILGVLCDGAPFGMDRFWEERSLIEGDAGHMQGKGHFMDYLLTSKDIEVNVQNKLNRTALFSCLAQGHFVHASTLLQHGADPSLRGRLYLHKNHIDVSPLFAALCRPESSPHAGCVKAQEQVTAQNLRNIATLVDQGYFDKPEIVAEIYEYIDRLCPELSHLKVLGHQLIPNIFGYITASLAQLSARKIFPQMISRKYHGIGTSGLQFSYSRLKLGDDTEVGERPGKESISFIEELVLDVDLPLDTVLNFEIEFLRQKLLDHFGDAHWVRYPEDDAGGYTTDLESDSDISSTDNDSDIEYW